MPKKLEENPIEKMQEWKEHQYNPGYWVNRFPPGFPPKRTRAYWLWTLIDVFLVVPAFIIVLFAFISKGDSTLLFLSILLGIFSLLVLARANAAKPSESGSVDGSSVKVHRQQMRSEKRHFPKRRKDYK